MYWVGVLDTVMIEIFAVAVVLLLRWLIKGASGEPTWPDAPWSW